MKLSFLDRKPAEVFWGVQSLSHRTDYNIASLIQIVPFASGQDLPLDII